MVPMFYFSYETYCTCVFYVAAVSDYFIPVSHIYVMMSLHCMEILSVVMFSLITRFVETLVVSKFIPNRAFSDRVLVNVPYNLCYMFSANDMMSSANDI